MKSIHTVVVGAGQSGLAVSRRLQRAQIAHVVLERSTSLGASWRALWDSFHLNTPNAFNVLPDAEPMADPDAFSSRDAWVDALIRYQKKHALPVLTGVDVRSVRARQGRFQIETQDTHWQSDNVVLCTGDQNVATLPKLAQQVPDDIRQLHARDYQNAAVLPAGGVLVVGSGQTGVQIAEDLREAGRDVWLCTSAVPRGPRRYRGRDIFSWLVETGMTEQRPDAVGPAVLRQPQPQISGTDGGHSVSLHSLARRGVVLLGRLLAIQGRTLQLADDLLSNAALGDTSSAKLCAGIDAFVVKTGAQAAPSSLDDADVPFEELTAFGSLRELEMSPIKTVIWATGFGCDYSYLDPAWLDDSGRPRHRDGCCEVDGLYTVGMQWLRRRVSGLILGVAEDAAFIVEKIEGSASMP